MNVEILSITQEPLKTMYVAARTCYSHEAPQEIAKTYSEEKALKLLKKIIDSGHSCYDDQTEVLTSNGFKLWKDITEEDLIASITPQSHKMVFEKPIRLVKSAYKGKMYLFDNKYINLCVTPNHRLYSSLINKVEDRKLEKFDFYKCEDIIYKNNKKTNVEVALRPQKFKTSCETSSTRWYNPLKLPENKLVAFNKLIGFFIGDGYAKSGNRIEFHLKKERKIAYLKNICLELNWEIKEYPNNKYKIFVEDIGDFARHNYYDNLDKHIPKELLNCSKECIEAFIDGLMNSDGSHNINNSFTYTTTSPQVADMLQTLVHIIGGHCSINERNNSTSATCKNCLTLHVRLKNNRNYVLVNDSRHAHKDTQVITYDGYVYCCEVSTGLLIVRRNNKICLCGNSLLEHVNVTFAIDGISRSIATQLTRHRHSTFSQRSTRYCKIKNSAGSIQGYIDLAEQGNPFLLKDLCSTYFVVDLDNTDLLINYAKQLIKYLELTEQGVKAEDAREVLPLALKTSLVMTCNLRELTYICGLRLCTRAQKPIRELVKEMSNLVTKEIPFMAPYLVPKCERIGYCDEDKSCGRKKSKGEILNVGQL